MHEQKANHYCFDHLVASAIYLVWPIKNDGSGLRWDTTAIEKKQRFLASLKPAKPGGSLPNVLLILTDDLGVNDISYYGNGKVSTPHIDGIARSGLDLITSMAFSIPIRSMPRKGPMESPTRRLKRTLPKGFGDTLMYNLSTDPYETNDQYSNEQGRAADMIRIHNEWSEGLPAALWPPIVHYGEKEGEKWFYFDN